MLNCVIEFCYWILQNKKVYINIYGHMSYIFIYIYIYSYIKIYIFLPGIDKYRLKIAWETLGVNDSAILN